MIQFALSRLAVARSPISISKRNFVSSVLLSRTWENESVAELKREAKVRGLSPYVKSPALCSEFFSSLLKKRAQGHAHPEDSRTRQKQGP